MKKIFMPIALLAIILVGCWDDDYYLPEEEKDSDGLVTPGLSILLSDSQSPMTGKMEVYPCEPGTAIYVGNYIDEKQTVLPGYYTLSNGTVFGESNRPLTLPVGTYTMIFWGTPKSEEPIYSSPTVTDVVLRLGTDLEKQYFSMRKVSNDTTYYPVLDLVYAVKPIHIGTDELQAALKRTVAGLKVTVKDKNNSNLSSSISSIDVHVGNISEKINVYTAQPVNPTCTVAFPLEFSSDGTQMSNATVMLFPSANNPAFKLLITLKDGTVKKYQHTLSAPFKANKRLDLTLVLGDILSGDNTGSFTIENWTEMDETIDVPPI